VRVRSCVALGLVAVASCLVLVGLLHPLTAARVDPVRRTISEYALGEFGWMFNTAVIGLAVGTALVLVALVAAGLLRWPSVAAFALAIGAVALLVVVAFEKANWSVGPSVGGYIHRYASLVAFLALPVAALAICSRWRGEPRFGRCAGWCRVLAALSFGWLSVIVAGMLLYPLAGVSWWQFVPLGLVERGLALTEVAIVVLLGCWSWRAAGPVAAERGRPAGERRALSGDAPCVAGRTDQARSGQPARGFASTSGRAPRGRPAL
jgi:Protein of unknown function (DUF998)